MLISHYRHLELQEGVAIGRELILRGSEERLAPILMTALATGLALVPIVLGGTRAGYEIEHPLPVVILGGCSLHAAQPVHRAGHLPEVRPFGADVGRGDNLGRPEADLRGSTHVLDLFPDCAPTQSASSNISLAALVAR